MAIRTVQNVNTAYGTKYPRQCHLLQVFRCELRRVSHVKLKLLLQRHIFIKAQLAADCFKLLLGHIGVVERDVFLESGVAEEGLIGNICHTPIQIEPSSYFL